MGDHNVIRQKCIDYIRARKNIFANFMQDDKNIDDYIEEMSKVGSWAKHIEIAWVSVLYNLKIDLYAVDNTLKNISKIRYSLAREGPRSIMLMYLSRLHYWPLIKIDEFSQITEECMISVEPKSKYNNISLVEGLSEKRKIPENIQDQLDKKHQRRVKKINNETSDEQESKLKKQRESRAEKRRAIIFNETVEEREN